MYAKLSAQDECQDILPCPFGQRGNILMTGGQVSLLKINMTWTDLKVLVLICQFLSILQFCKVVLKVMVVFSCSARIDISPAQVVRVVSLFVNVSTVYNRYTMGLQIWLGSDQYKLHNILLESLFQYGNISSLFEQGVREDQLDL